MSFSLSLLSKLTSLSTPPPVVPSTPISAFTNVQDVYEAAEGMLSTFQSQVTTGTVYRDALNGFRLLKRHRTQESTDDIVKEVANIIIEAHRAQEKLSDIEENLADKIFNECDDIIAFRSMALEQVKNAKVWAHKGTIYLSKETKLEDVIKQLQLFKMFQEKNKIADQKAGKIDPSDKKPRSISQPVVPSSPTSRATSPSSAPSLASKQITMSASSIPLSSFQSSSPTFASFPISLVASTNTERRPPPPPPPASKPLRSPSSSSPISPINSERPTSPLPPFHRPGGLSMSGIPGLPPLSPKSLPPKIPTSPGTSPRAAKLPGRTHSSPAPHMRNLTEIFSTSTSLGEDPPQPTYHETLGSPTTSPILPTTSPISPTTSDVSGSSSIKSASPGRGPPPAFQRVPSPSVTSRPLYFVPQSSSVKSSSRRTPPLGPENSPFNPTFFSPLPPTAESASNMSTPGITPIAFNALPLTAPSIPKAPILTSSSVPLAPILEAEETSSPQLTSVSSRSSASTPSATSDGDGGGLLSEIRRGVTLKRSPSNAQPDASSPSSSAPTSSPPSDAGSLLQTMVTRVASLSIVKAETPPKQKNLDTWDDE